MVDMGFRRTTTTRERESDRLSAIEQIAETRRVTEQVASLADRLMWVTEHPLRPQYPPEAGDRP